MKKKKASVPRRPLSSPSCQCSTRQESDRVTSDYLLASHVEAISSPMNAYVKHCVKLRRNGAYRRKARMLLVVGETPLREICQYLMDCSQDDLVMDVLFILQNSIVPLSLSSFAKRIVRVSYPVMQKLSGLESLSSEESIVGVLPLPSSFSDLGAAAGDFGSSWCSTGSRILALDGIQDPGNLGTLLRTAAAFAWDGVFLLPGCCDPFNDKAIRAARGATYRVPLAMGEWSHLETITSIQKMPLYAGDPSTEDISYNKSKTEGSDSVKIDSSNLSIAGNEDKLCLVLGSEGQGLSEEAKMICRGIAIPMPGGFESLNVAVAGGILLYLLQNKNLIQR